jgi:hypothetical protein
MDKVILNKQDKRTGFSHHTNKMRTRWEEGVRSNIEKLDFTRAMLKTWADRGGWETCPEYMQRLERNMKKQKQYLRNRLGQDFET